LARAPGHGLQVFFDVCARDLATAVTRTSRARESINQ
jgi:hypothetical protein